MFHMCVLGRGEGEVMFLCGTSQTISLPSGIKGPFLLKASLHNLMVTTAHVAFIGGE